MSLVAFKTFEDKGGFQLDLGCISGVKNHMTSYRFVCSHWWKISLKKNPLQDLLSSLKSECCHFNQ